MIAEEADVLFLRASLSEAANRSRSGIVWSGIFSAMMMMMMMMIWDDGDKMAFDEGQGKNVAIAHARELGWVSAILPSSVVKSKLQQTHQTQCKSNAINFNKRHTTLRSASDSVFRFIAIWSWLDLLLVADVVTALSWSERSARLWVRSIWFDLI